MARGGARILPHLRHVWSRRRIYRARPGARSSPGDRAFPVRVEAGSLAGSLAHELERPADERRARLHRVGRRELQPLGQLELAEQLAVELTGPDVEVLAGQEQAANAELAVAL